jgi:hypothetical protein
MHNFLNGKKNLLLRVPLHRCPISGDTSVFGLITEGCPLCALRYALCALHLFFNLRYALCSMRSALLSPRRPVAPSPHRSSALALSSCALRHALCALRSFPRAALSPSTLRSASSYTWPIIWHHLTDVIYSI